MINVLKNLMIVVILFTYSCSGERINYRDKNDCPYQPIENIEQYTTKKDGTVNNSIINVRINSNLKKIALNTQIKDSLEMYNSLINDSLKTTVIYSITDISEHNRLISILCSKWKNSRDTTLPKDYRNHQLIILDSLELLYFNYIMTLRGNSANKQKTNSSVITNINTASRNNIDTNSFIITLSFKPKYVKNFNINAHNILIDDIKINPFDVLKGQKKDDDKYKIKISKGKHTLKIDYPKSNEVIFNVTQSETIFINF